jgi:hypothetical protein
MTPGSLFVAVGATHRSRRHGGEEVNMSLRAAFVAVRPCSAGAGHTMIGVRVGSEWPASAMVGRSG